MMAAVFNKIKTKISNRLNAKLENAKTTVSEKINKDFTDHYQLKKDNVVNIVNFILKR